MIIDKYRTQADAATKAALTAEKAAAKATAKAVKTANDCANLEAAIAAAKEEVAKAEAAANAAEQAEQDATSDLEEGRSELEDLKRAEKTAFATGCYAVKALATGRLMEFVREGRLEQLERKLKAKREFSRGREAALNRAIAKAARVASEAEPIQSEANKAKLNAKRAETIATEARFKAAKAVNRLRFVEKFLGCRTCHVSEEEQARQAQEAKRVEYLRRSREEAYSRRGAKPPSAAEMEAVNAWRKANGLRPVMA